MSNVIDKVLLELLDYKNKNKNVIDGLQEEFEKADKIIFNETCLKPHLSRCEPEFCSFRILNKCKYPQEYARLKVIIEK